MLGFVDYTSCTAESWDNGQIDVSRAYDCFAAASAPAAADAFLKRHLFANNPSDNAKSFIPDAAARVTDQMLE